MALKVRASQTFTGWAGWSSGGLLSCGRWVFARAADSFWRQRVNSAPQLEVASSDGTFCAGPGSSGLGPGGDR